MRKMTDLQLNNRILLLENKKRILHDILKESRRKCSNEFSGMSMQGERWDMYMKRHDDLEARIKIVNDTLIDLCDQNLKGL